MVFPHLRPAKFILNSKRNRGDFLSVNFSDGNLCEVEAGWIGDGLARRIEKGWIGDENGIARLFFDSETQNKTLFCTLRSPKSSYATGDGFFTSEDGLIWTETLDSNIGLYNSFYVVTCNGKFFTINRYGNIYYSTDGIAWTQISKPLSAAYKLYSYNNTLMLRATSSSVYYSKDDGATWTKLSIQGINSANSFYSILYGKLNGETEEKYYIVTESNSSAYAHQVHVYSKDFVWEKNINGLVGSENLIKGASMVNGVLAIFYRSSSTTTTYMYRYVDGAWKQTILTNIIIDEMYNASNIDDKAVFFAKESTEYHLCIFDGETLTVVKNAIGTGLSYPVISGRMANCNGRLFGVVGAGGTSQNTIAYSDDTGETWTRITVTAVKSGCDMALLIS